VGGKSLYRQKTLCSLRECIAFSLQNLFVAFDGVMNQKKGVNTIPYIKKGNKGFKFLHQKANKNLKPIRGIRIPLLSEREGLVQRDSGIG